MNPQVSAFGWVPPFLVKVSFEIFGSAGLCMKQGVHTKSF